MFANMPETAKEWADKTNFSKLPEKAKKKKKKGKDTKDTKDTNDVFQGEKSLESHGDKLAQALYFADVFFTHAKSRP